ncbi:MAG: hypothetical protein EBV86_00645, partial [Marivivens sp.]|nr:hypothetical protein [Marivivens sp.]
KDIRKLIEDGRAVAGPEIVFSLQSKGPWWTGNFGELWELSPTPVKPVVSNTRDWEGENMPTSRSFQKRPALRVPINSPLYIGNLADYAGYAVNNPQAKIDGKTYGETRPPRRSTAKPGPKWYKIYTETNRDAGLFLDLDKAFASVRLG